MTPLIERGEIRSTSMAMITAIVNGPAHAIARRWLAGQLTAPLTDWVDELTDAACAALRGTGAPARPPRPQSGRFTLELVSDDGKGAVRVTRGAVTSRAHELM